jgi:hypothetical protein
MICGSCSTGRLLAPVMFAMSLFKEGIYSKKHSFYISNRRFCYIEAIKIKREFNSAVVSVLFVGLKWNSWRFDIRTKAWYFLYQAWYFFYQSLVFFSTSRGIFCTKAWYFFSNGQKQSNNGKFDDLCWFTMVVRGAFLSKSHVCLLARNLALK